MLRRLQAAFPTPDLSIEAAEFLADDRKAKIFIVDDDYFSRTYVRELVAGNGWDIAEFDSAESFLKAYSPLPEACLILDVQMAGMSGIDLLAELSGHDHLLPTIVVSGSSWISQAVQSVKRGALDFIQKPADPDILLKDVRAALDRSRRANTFRISRKAALDHLASLTARQRQILTLILLGAPSKNIAADLGISQRTVENHRAEIMHRMGAHSVPALCEMTLASIWRPADEITIDASAV
jgi:two-component system CheB/CheR fusion protein